MTNLKSFILRTYLFTYSPLFPIVLGSIIFITYRIYFEPVLLCDDHGYLLYELKRNLTKEIAKWRLADIECALYQDLQEQETKFCLKVRTTDLDREEEIHNNLIQSVAKMHNALSNMKDIENTIKKLDPNFKSPIDYNFFRIKTKN